MSFEQQVQHWVSLDNQLKIYNDKIKEIRDQKNELTERITNYALKNQLNQSTIQISDGKLRFVQTKVQPPLTFKYLEKVLGEVISNENQVKIILEHIKNKRETKTVSEIKRYNNN